MELQQTKKDIRTLDLNELESWVIDHGIKKYRASQIYEWLWKKSAGSFDEMTNLSKKDRDLLNTEFILETIKIDAVQHSLDGTIKTRFKLHDGNFIEAVLIPVEKDNRFTVCVSSQVGCSLSCKFCATGMMKRMRNLDASEIYDQYVFVNQQSMERFGHPLTNIVYMGMGEPLLNYKQVNRSIELLTSENGLNIAARRITISTAGIAKMIMKLADDQSKCNLALSLHAADDLKRNEIMPINEQNNLEVLKEALKYFNNKTGNRISLEYIAFKDFNDGISDAKHLASFCADFPCRVNIIEYNPIEGLPYVKSNEDTIDRFMQYLLTRQIRVTLRRSRGKDIDAACGQLANKA